MWRRLSIHLSTLAPSRSAPKLVRCAAESSAAPANVVRPFAAFSRRFSTESGSATPKRVEDIMPIATGHEREELEAELKGIDLLEETNNLVGPFGTKEAPAKIKAYYSKRIIGCPGGEGEDEHDVVWFWLEQGKPHECPVCGQYFELEVVGPGGPPPGYEDSEEENDHEHH